MTEVVMVRHGQSEHNRDGIIQGQIDSELTEKGRRQAEELGESLSGEEFDRIYVSDLKRAAQTAEIALEDGTEFTRTENLRERYYGDLEGEGFEIWDEIEAEDHHEWNAEGAESLKEHKERVMEVLDESIDDGLERVLIIAHGGSIAAALMDIINCDSRQAWRFSVGSCSITRIVHSQSDGWLIKEVGCSC